MPLAGPVGGACAVWSITVVIIRLDARPLCGHRHRPPASASTTMVLQRALPSLAYCATAEVTGLALSCFFFQSPMAARIASSANTEQWIFTGGSESSFTISVFLICRASSTVLPLTHSVAREEEAIAEPQPKVLNFASSMMLVTGLTLICSFMTSPHSGAPTSPVPTSGLLLSNEPTLRGLV